MYSNSQDDNLENDFNYLSEGQIEELKNKLLDLKFKLESKRSSTATSLKDSSENDPDLYSRSIMELNLDLKAQDADSQAKTLNEVNLALDKIKAGSYGYCEITGEPIGLKRLKVMPYTRYSILVQESMEASKDSQNQSDL